MSDQITNNEPNRPNRHRDQSVLNETPLQQNLLLILSKLKVDVINAIQCRTHEHSTDRQH